MKQIGWIAGPAGIEKYTPPPPPVRLSQEERWQAYAKAIKRLSEFFNEVGFRCNAIEQGDTSLTYERDGVMFDVSIREPMRVAYVTSHVGYKYEKVAAGLTPNIRTPKGLVVGGQVLYKPTATVKLLGEAIQSEYVAQVILTIGDSNVPVYIELPDNQRDPETYLICNILGVMRMLAAQHPKLGTVFQRYLEHGPEKKKDLGPMQQQLDAMGMEPGELRW